MDIKFGTDGWRGLIDKDFNEKNVALAVQAIAMYFFDKGKRSVVIGYDTRRKAEKFARIAAEIMAGNGIKVFLVNRPCPTPVTGWSIINKRADGAIMFTASHNPGEYLGLKYMTEEAMVAPTDVTDCFMEHLKTLKPKKVKSMGFYYAHEINRISTFDPRKAYFKKLRELVDVKRIRRAKLKVLLNPMYGAGVGYLRRLLIGSNLTIKEINNKHDENFGGLSPEPIVGKNVLDAIEVVKREKFDICLACDGDADRIGLIDEKGRLLSSLEAFLILTYYIVGIKKKVGPVVRTLSNTIMVDHLGQNLSFPVFETKVGFKYVGEQMKQVNAVFGGEESGGSAVDNFILVRDAQLMNLFILDMMVELNMSLSELLTLVQVKAGGAYVFRREDVHLPYEGYEEVKEKVTRETLEKTPAEILGKKVVKTRQDDGIKFVFEDDAWLLIRFSGTEPVLRTYAEAKTKEEVDRLLTFAKEYCK